MKDRLYIYCFIISLLGSAYTLQAQSHDYGGIAEIKLSKSINKKLTLKLEEEVRFNENLSNLNRAKTVFEVNYNLIKKRLDTEFGYEYHYRDKVNVYEHRHRAFFGLVLEQRFDPVRLKYKSTVQSTWRDELRGNYSYNPSVAWRNKLTIQYRPLFYSWRPYASGELFLPLTGKRQYISDSYRLSSGVKYKIDNQNTIDLYLRYDQEIQQRNPKSILYGGVAWNYSF